MLALRSSRDYIKPIETNSAEQDEMITINQNVVAEIKAEAESFGFPATSSSIARDYFARMSYEDKAVVMTANASAKGVTALSRACIATVAGLIAA